MNTITRQQMIDAVTANIEGRKKANWAYAAKGRNSFGAWGNARRIFLAEGLLQRLENGTNPTTAEVVGYFGKGARFEA